MFFSPYAGPRWKVADNDINVAELVPKLTDDVNWKDWKAKLLLALRATNPIYADLITGTIPTPDNGPACHDCSFQHVRSLMRDERNGDEEMIIADDDVEARIEAIRYYNSQLIKQYLETIRPWNAANVRARDLLYSTLGPDALDLVSDFANARDAYLELKFYFKDDSHNYSKWETLLDMRFKTGSSTEFVSRFKKLLRRYANSVGELPPSKQFYLFKRAISHYPQWHKLFERIKVNEAQRDLMRKVYSTFVLLDSKELRKKRAAKACESARTTQLAIRPSA
jgi:hypothetical protein